MVVDALALVLILALFAERVWRFLALDDLTVNVRLWSEEHLPWYVAGWLRCPWCIGTWIAVGVTLLAGIPVHLPLPPWLLAGAVAGLTGFLGTLDKKAHE